MTQQDEAAVLERRQQVRTTFDTVASSYDHPGAFWFDQSAQVIAGLVRELSSAAAAGAELKVLDVATGTGKVALAIAEAVPQAQVLGVDLSAGMLAVAQKKADLLKLHHLSWQQAAFEDLNFGPSFDVLSCSFGIFFVQDMCAALSTFARQVKAGGHLLLASFAEGAFSPFSDAFVRRYVEYGFEVPPPPWLRVATPERISALFAEAGLLSPQVETHDFSFELSSPQVWWDIVYNAGYRGLLQRMQPDALAQFKAAHLREVAEIMEAEGPLLNVKILITQGQIAG